MKRVEATRAYKAEYGRANAPEGHREAAGFRLGQWQRHLRSKYQKGRVTAREIKAMEEVGFQWKMYESSFERGFQETVNCKATTGNPNVLREYKTRDGFKLGRWQSSIRCAYQTGRLSKERIQRLSKIGFVWHLIKEAHKRGIEETRKYKKEHETPNCPSQYITAEGYRLGQWQSKIKMGRKRGTLTPETIRELKALGFDWRRSYKKLKGSIKADFTMIAEDKKDK